MKPDEPTSSSPRQVFLDACAEGRLTYQHGVQEGAVFPPRLPETGRTEPLEWRNSSGRGKIYSLTTVFPRNDRPFVVALIDLQEGFRMMSRIDVVDPQSLSISQRVEVRFRKLEEGGPDLPVFVPVGYVA